MSVFVDVKSILQYIVSHSIPSHCTPSMCCNCICKIVKQSGHQTHLSYSNEAICLLNAHCRTLQMNCIHAVFGKRFRVIYPIPLKLYISSYMSYLLCSFSALKFKYRDYQHQFQDNTYCTRFCCSVARLSF